MDFHFSTGIMASIPSTTPSSGVTTSQSEMKPPTTLRRANSRRRFWRLRRKRKLPTVTLGGQRQLQQGTRSGSVMVKLMRRMRIRWSKLKKAFVLKKLKEYYLCVLKDLTEQHQSLENYQQMLVKETSFAVPVMGMSFNAFR